MKSEKLRLDLQVKLLRVLQEQEFERLGSARTTRVNVRVVAATNRDLMQMIEAKEFRADLYYRLSVFPVSLPPLRDRPEDIPALARHFMSSFRGSHEQRCGRPFLPETMEAMLAYDWPGNIRELQNFMERGVILSIGSVFQPPFTPSAAREHGSRCPQAGKLWKTPCGSIFCKLWTRTKWVLGGRQGTAAYLGVARTTLIAKMRRLGIESSRNAGYPGRASRQAGIRCHGMNGSIGLHKRGLSVSERCPR